MKYLLLATLLVFSSLAFAATWDNVVLIDQACASKAKANPDAHTTDCAKACAGSGYGILTSNGDFLKFDQKGNDQAMKLLKSTDKKDHLRVSVEGEQKGKTIEVSKLAFK